MATTYYVDSLDGRDENDGLSQQTAFRSLAPVNELKLEPGDNILIRAGSDLDGSLKPNGKGAPGKPIYIGMYGDGPMPRINASGRHMAAIHLYNTEYITVEGLHVTNYGETRGDHRRGIFIELEDFGTAHEISIRHNRVTDVNGSLYKKTGGGGISIQGRGPSVITRFNGLLIEHNHLQRTGRNGITGGSNHVGRDNWHPSHNVVIRNNLIEELPGDAIVPVGMDGTIVRGNVVRYGTPLLVEKDHQAAAGIWPWASDNTLIEFNEVSHHRALKDGQGFDADWNCRGTIIQYNYSHNNDGGFLLICNDGSSKPDWNAGNTGVIIRYNVSFNDGLREVDETTTPGFRAPTINVNGPVDGALVHDNLIIIPAKTTPKVENNIMIATSWAGYPSNIRFERNTVVTQGPVGFDSTKGANFVYENNAFFGPVSLPAEMKAVTSEQKSVEDPSIFLFPGTGLDTAFRLLKQHHKFPLPEGLPN